MRVDRMAFAGVVFAHRDQALALAVEHEVGVAQRALGGQRDRVGAVGRHVQPVVGEIRKVDRAVGHQQRAAAVFVHAACAR